MSKKRSIFEWTGIIASIITIALAFGSMYKFAMPQIDQLFQKTEIETHKETQEFTGWIYAGRHKGKRWVAATIESQKTPKEGDIITIKEDVSLRRGYPEFPLYDNPPTIEPHHLKSETKAKIIESRHNIGLRNFTWLKVSNINP